MSIEHEQQWTTGRRAFLKTTAAAAVAIAARKADAGTPAPKYPRGRNLGPHCELVLWLTQYADANETDDPWKLKEIYSRPLITDAGVPGLLDELVSKRIEFAAKTNPPFITIPKKDNVLGAINAFKGSGDNSRTLSIVDLMLAGIAHDHPSPPPPDPLHDLLKALHDNGIYLLSNNVSQDIGDKLTIQELLFSATGNVPLFDFTVPSGVSTGTTKPLGEMTFKEMFETRLEDVYKNHRASFYALKLAKEAGILKPVRPLSQEGPDGTVITIMTPKNNRCCDVTGTGECKDQPFRYCDVVSLIDLHCNSMSDSCS